MKEIRIFAYYVISLDKTSNTEHTHNAIKLVNRLLELDVDVRWLQKRRRGEKRDYQKGDFVIILNHGESTKNKILINYLLKTAEELGVTVYPEPGLDESSLVTAAHKLVKPEIAVYYGNGTSDGAIWFVQSLEKMGFDIGIVTENDILEGALENYNVLIIGGGMDFCRYLGKKGCKRIEEFVHNGGGYIGHCGGAVAVVKRYPKSSCSSWLELAEVSLELKEDGFLTAAYASGPVIYNITMPEHPVMFGYRGKIPLDYLWGPIFSSEVGKNVSVLATILAPSPDIQTPSPEITRVAGIMPSIEELNKSTGKPAILAANYGHGKVVVASPHPETPGSEHAYRLVANEVFYVTSFCASPGQHRVADFNKDYSSNRILEEVLREVKVAEEIAQEFADKDAMVYGVVAETMLLYLVDSVDRLEKIKNFDMHELSFESISNEYIRSLVDDAVKKHAIAVDKLNSLTEPKTIELVQNTITFLRKHRESLNKTLDLRDKLKGSVTDEYANLVKVEHSSYKDAGNAYKYGVEAKILDVSFAVAGAERAAKFAKEAIGFYLAIFK